MIQPFSNTGTFILDTDDFDAPIVGHSLYETRKRTYEAWGSKYTATIVVLGYNRLIKTRTCVECILKYTTNIKYELILIDNGSSDETREYFESVPYEHKKVWKITKNIGANFPLTMALRVFEGKYFVYVPNDIYVTANWLFNLLRCYESSPQIGIATPVSSNISNLQQMDLQFENFDDMQKKAANFNQHDPTKWVDRLRLMPPILIFTREICDVVGTIDLGFYYDFADDDISARIRHAGYRLVLCKDTYVYHDHANLVDKDPVLYQESLDNGRKNYRDKYFGVDAWDDFNNFEILGMRLLFENRYVGDHLKVLGIDVRCGTPILEIRNHLREKHSLNNELYAYTSKAMYFKDLQLVTKGNTVCDRIEFLLEHYPENSFDYIVLGEPVNFYAQPIKVTENLLRLTKKGGKIIVSLKNIADVFVFLKVHGMVSSLDGNMSASISNSDFLNCIKMLNVSNVTHGAELHSLDTNTIEEIKRVLVSSGLCKDLQNTIKELCINLYIFCIEK